MSVLDERLAWSRARLVEEGQQHAEKLMEMMIAASMAGVPEMSADLSNLPVDKKEDGPPILYELHSPPPFPQRHPHPSMLEVLILILIQIYGDAQGG